MIDLDAIERRANARYVENNATFVLAYRREDDRPEADMQALIAEVRRLREENTELRAKLAYQQSVTANIIDDTGWPVEKEQ